METFHDDVCVIKCTLPKTTEASLEQLQAWVLADRLKFAISVSYTSGPSAAVSRDAID